MVFEEPSVMAEISEPQMVQPGSNSTALVARVEPQPAQEKPLDPVQSYLFNSKPHPVQPGLDSTTVVARVEPQAVKEQSPKPAQPHRSIH